MSETARTPPQTVLEWDLSRTHRIADIDWPAELARPQRFLEGEITLTLKLPEGRVLKLELADIRAERKDDQLSALVLRGHGQPLDKAVVAAEKWMDQLALPRQDLDQWSEDARSGDFRKSRVFASRNDLLPALSLEIKHSYDPERPWYLAWEIAWPTLAQPAPAP